MFRAKVAYVSSAGTTGRLAAILCFYSARECQAIPEDAPALRACARARERSETSPGIKGATNGSFSPNFGIL